MPAVFVHGVPDTSELWAPVLAALTRDDVATMSLPGFGASIPDGFGATKDEYAAWLAEQIAAITDPVDVVGHDWGALLTERVVITRPELVRSYVLVNSALTEAFRWHDLAVQWQTPEVGEQIMELMVGEPVVTALRDAGHPEAERAATAIDDTMRRCVLSLYRSAVDIAREWAPSGPIERPGFVLWGRDDPYAPPASAERFATLTGARVVFLDGGHWGAFAHPEQTVAALESFWAQLR